MLDLGTLLRVPCVESDMGFDISPDGGRVAFSWNPDGRWEIFEIPTDGSSTPRQVTQGEGGKFHPHYSPDGRRLAYAVDFEGSENYHIFIHDLATGAHVDLTPHVEYAIQAFFSWSPDGRQIAYLSDRFGQFDAYVMTVGDGFERLEPDRFVLDAGHPACRVKWSPDGRWLAVTVEASGTDFGVYIVPAEGGEARRIGGDREPLSAKDACWSPDSRTIAFASDLHDNFNIGLYDLGSEKISWLTEGEGQKQYPDWSPDGKRLVYVINRGAVSWLAIQTPGEPPVLQRVEAGVHYLPRFTPNGRNVFFLFDNPRHPTGLWSLEPDGRFGQLLHSLPADLPAEQFILPEEITYPGMDGTPVPALLFRPAARRPAPAVVLIHGGPDWFFEATWYPFMAHLASRGWVVLAPNYRGSTGYGRTWQQASRFDFGGVDTDDVAAGAQYLVREGLADPQRIGVTGRSHGGYLTASCLTRYPELWAVGSAVVPFLNWFTNHELRADLQHWDIENFGDPEINHDLWRDRSPSYFLDRVRAPLQLICGQFDVRCPTTDSIEAERVLQEMGKVVDFKMYPEGHTFLKMENLLDSEQRRIDFLRKYLE